MRLRAARSLQEARRLPERQGGHEGVVRRGGEEPARRQQVHSAEEVEHRQLPRRGRQPAAREAAQLLCAQPHALQVPTLLQPRPRLVHPLAHRREQMLRTRDGRRCVCTGGAATAQVWPGASDALDLGPAVHLARLEAIAAARGAPVSDGTHHIANVGVVGRLVPRVVACARLVLAAPRLDLKQAKLAELERPVPIGPGAHGGSGVVRVATRAAPTPTVEGAHHEAGVGMTATALAAFGIAWARNSASP